MRICSIIIPLGALAAFGLIAVSPDGVRAGAAPEEALSLLQERGYRDIEIEPGDAPGYQAWACKGDTRFSVKLDADSNIVDVDPVGNCDGAPRNAETDKGDVHVRAPFADVRVGKDGVHIRAPFVDLKIPR